MYATLLKSFFSLSLNLPAENSIKIQRLNKLLAVCICIASPCLVSFSNTWGALEQVFFVITCRSTASNVSCQIFGICRSAYIEEEFPQILFVSLFSFLWSSGGTRHTVFPRSVFSKATKISRLQQ